MNDDFVAFAHAASGRLHNLAMALGASSSDAEDLVQVTLERVYSAWNRAAIAEPFAYARTALMRAHISERRRVRWQREVIGLPVRETGAHQESEDRLVLHQALRGLPERQRQAVVLRYLEDLPVTVVADLMRCTEGTVKRSAHDGLKNLRTTIAPAASDAVQDHRGAPR